MCACSFTTQGRKRVPVDSRDEDELAHAVSCHRDRHACMCIHVIRTDLRMQSHVTGTDMCACGFT